MQMSMGDVAAILGTPCSGPERMATGYSIDSRTARPGDLFFAIRGPNYDGHEFVATAMKRGAMGAVVEWGFFDLAPRDLAPALVPVRSPTDALQRLALAVRTKWARPLVAITGSAGKTTTKEMLGSILARRFSVLKSAGNLNNDYGLPLTLLGLELSHEVAVVELAMSAPGEIARLARIAVPQVGLVTNVAPVHLQFFDSVDSIARAKRELIDNLGASSTAVLNHDDPRVRGFAGGFGGRIVTFGFEPGATFQALDLRTPREGEVEFRVKGEGLDESFLLPVPGRHNVQNALAAIAAASLFEIPPSGIREALARFQTLRHRSEIIPLPGGITVLNDSYNSNPLAMQRLLETLAAWPGAKRRIVVAGEMLELGATSPELHTEVGRKCVESGVDCILAVQGDANFILDGAREQGLPQEQGQFFQSAEEAGKYCADFLHQGDVVLVKGSRGVHLEKVIELLQSHAEISLPPQTGLKS
jgi:UDP-N-acetylmuramoyl-tripeptide--D-alanyl-D-alanine ligase